MAGYSRTNTADIQSGQVVKSAPINAELNAVVTAFAFDGGHNHDGSSTEGAYVGLIADIDALNKVVVDTSNNRIGFFSEVSSAATEQVRIQDGAILPVTDNDIDLGASGTEFKDLFIDGTAHVDTLDVDENATITGTLGVTGAVTANAGVVVDNITIDGTEIDLSSGDLTVDVAGDIILDAEGGDFKFQDGGTEILRITNSSSDVVIRPVVDAKDIIFQQRDGTEVARIEDNGTFNVVTDKLAINGTAVTSTAAELNILDGVTANASELNLLDGVSGLVQGDFTKLAAVDATAAELNIVDGDTSATSTTVADADRVVLNDNGTMVQVAVTDLAAYFDDEITAMPNLVTTAATTVGALDSGSISSGFGNIDVGSSNLTATGTVSLGATSFNDNAITNVGDIALDSISADDTDINVAVTDNSATAFTIKQGSDAYLIVDTGNSSESVSIGTGVSGTAITIGHGTSEVTIGDNLTVTGNLTVSGTQTVVDTVTMNAQNAIVFEGATADDHETTLTITDPTADRTIKLPNQSGTLPVLAADSDTAITSTPAELNILDGGTSAGTTAVAGGDGIVTNDGGTMRQTTVDTFDTYLSGTTKTLTNKTLTTPIIEEIDSSSTITLDAGTDIILDAGGSDIFFKINGTDVVNFFRNGDGDFAMYQQQADKKYLFQGNNLANGGSITALTLDIGNNGNATFLGTVTANAGISSSGTVTYGSLSDGSITITGFVDEDDMASNSATLIPTQQSVEARIQAVNGASNNVSGLTATGAELNVLDGASAGTIVNSKGVIYGSGGQVNATSLQIAGTDLTATAAEFNLLDGGSTVGTTAVAGGDGILTNDGGTMRQTSVDTFDTYLAGTTKTLTNKTLTAPKFADGGFIADANGNELIMLQTASSAVNQLEVTNSATGGAVVVGASGDDSNIDIDISPKGTGEVNIAAGNLNYGGTAVTATGAELNLTDGSSSGTIVNSKAVIYGSSGEVNATTLQIAGSSITATSAELNIMDGDTSASSTTLVDADRLVTNDAGTMKQVALTDLQTYLSSAGFATKGFATAMAIAL
jgi:hypothetical protein